jgi:hypothetical protein
MNKTMNEEFRIIAQSYIGMKPKDKGCKTWGEMQQKMADELENVVKNLNILDVSVRSEQVCDHHRTKLKTSMAKGYNICECGKMIEQTVL